MAPCSQRKYIDLIHKISSKWVNWDPPIKIRVGTYGTVDRETGDLLAEGNIYDAEFQGELDKHGVKLNMAGHLPEAGPIEDDFIIASRGAKRGDMNADHEADIPGIATASVKGQWTFERGKRDAVLIMHNPRQYYLPPKVVLEALYRVDKLIDKWLVTSIHMCPAYSMYLSDKADDKLSLALVAQAPIAGVAGVTAGAGAGVSWWCNARNGLLRKACDQTGRYEFTPLYSLKRPIRRFPLWNRFRDRIPEPSGDDLWVDDSPPWEPLDEDGNEDPFDPEIRDVNSSARLTGAEMKEERELA